MKTVVLTLGICCTLMAVSLTGGAQDKTGGSPTARGDGTHVALVDIEHVFKNYARFKQQMDKIKQEVESFDKELGEERKGLATLKDRRDSFNVGSPEYKKVEEDMARRMSDVQVRSQLKRKEVIEREAKVYFDTFSEITKEVSRLADQYDINLVLRFEGQDIDVRDPTSVSAGLRRQVIFHRNLDLTPLVLERLNATATRPTSTTSPGSGKLK